MNPKVTVYLETEHSCARAKIGAAKSSADAAMQGVLTNTALGMAVCGAFMCRGVGGGET